MKNLFIYKILICLILITVSCEDDFLEKKPKTEFSEIDVFSDPVLIETFVNGIYEAVSSPYTGGDGMLKAEYVDEAHDMWYNYFEFNNSLISSDDLQGWWLEEWNGVYSDIRRCNLFFEKVDNGKFDANLVNGVLLKDRLMGEVHFLRAFFYQHH